MATGWNTKRIGQIGEFLFCAEVARECDCIATPFAGNVPIFDVLVTDARCRTIPVQVKTADGGAWQFDADKYLAIEFDEDAETQAVNAACEIDHADLVLALVWLGTKRNKPDRIFILTRRDLQSILHRNHSRWLEKHGGHRPKNWRSTHCSVLADDLDRFANNWALITERLEMIQQRPAPP